MFREDNKYYKILHLLTNTSGKIYPPAKTIINEMSLQVTDGLPLETQEKRIKEAQFFNPKLLDQTPDMYLGINGISSPYTGGFNKDKHIEECLKHVFNNDWEKYK